MYQTDLYNQINFPYNRYIFYRRGDMEERLRAGAEGERLHCLLCHPTQALLPVALTSPQVHLQHSAGRAMGDMQVSSEYVAYNLHYLSQLSGALKPAVISHSQGGPNTQWALQFWPSTRAVTSSFIPLSPDFEGIDLLGSDFSNFCVGNLCQACIWQQSDGSNYFEALHGHDFAALVPTTVVWSKTDGVVEPAKINARLPGSTAISLQDLCPLRFTTHVQMTMDAAAFAMALDALQNGGIGSLARVKKQRLKTCWRIGAPDMDINIADQIREDFDSIIKGYILGDSRVSTEPTVMAYAQ
ncbi:hypothetical protein D0867_13620 [Hortaea werneckii]|uniref:AB hydrolase-1 domain-containing protein n=1 Tax=Hortaea werneckii TaxID=91943 RepID=A0A3M6ZK08_HORWE|nr:hypothetical protein D0867_13620 [Hortaea werneckii]RMY15510.1 hypothetical protein D0866_13797 [Hortaea werneckii]